MSLLCSIAAATQAFSYDTYRCGKLYFDDGSVMDIGRTDVFDADWNRMTLTAGVTGHTLEFPLDGIIGWNYYFDRFPVVTSAGEVEADAPGVEWLPGEIRVSLSGNGVVAVSNVSGHVIKRYEANPDVVIPTSEYTPGIYVISTCAGSYKVRIGSK